MRSLSQSVLSSAGDCLRKAQYTIDPPQGAKRKAGSSRAVGTGYHAGLELRYTARRDGTALPTLDDMIGYGIEIFNTSMVMDLYDNTPVDEFIWADNVPDADHAHDFITRMLSTYMEGGHEWPADWHVLAVEVHGNYPDPLVVGTNVKFGGDLVLVDPNGWLVIDDHKTAGKAWPQGKESARKNVQSPFYGRIAKTVYPGYPGYRFVFSVMTYPTAKNPPKFERRISDPTPEQETAVMVRADQFVQLYTVMHEQMGLDLPANPGSTLCNPKWCDHWDVCPHGAAIDN